MASLVIAFWVVSLALIGFGTSKQPTSGDSWHLSLWTVRFEKDSRTGVSLPYYFVAGCPKEFRDNLAEQVELVAAIG